MKVNLKEIFENINFWLKYAEAKNGVLIALNGTLLVAILRLINNNEIPYLLMIYFIPLLLLSSLSLLIGLLSFIPELKLPYLDNSNLKTKDSDNLIFFGHIQKYSPNNYLQELLNKDEFNKLEIYYSYQIVNNSVITSKKFRFFKISAWLLIASVFTPIIATAIYLLYNTSSNRKK